MQNPFKKFRQSSIIFEERRTLFENVETLASSNYPRVWYFLLKFCTRFPLTNVYKRMFMIFYFIFLFRSWVICKNLETPVFAQSFFTFLLIIQVLNKIKKKPQHIFVDIKKETFAKFQQKILNSVTVGARQSFQFCRQITWFLGNNRASSLGIGFCLTLLVL